MRKSPGILAVMVLASCGAPPNLPSGASTDVVAPAPATVRFDELPDGECGGFAGNERSEALPLLAGRLRVRGPAGIGDSPRPHSIMAAPHAAQLESRLFLEGDGGERFVVFGLELFRTPSEDFLDAVREDVGEGYTVAPLEVASPLRAVVAVPDELDFTDEAVDVAIAYTVTEDELVQRVGFYVTPDAARTGGCRRLGLELASTLVAGNRPSSAEAGPHVLTGTLGLELSAGQRLVVQEGPDFTVYRVHPVLPLGSGQGELGMYIGNHPSFSPPDDAARTTFVVLGQSVEWHDWESDGVRKRQALVPFGPSDVIHIFMYADQPAILEALTAVAASLRRDVQVPPLAACPAGARLPAVEADAEVLALDALQTLLRAPSFSIHRRTWDADRVEPTAAFFELAAHPRAAESFRYLAVHGTTAGKLYGLAGLYLDDSASFDAFVCAVRETLEPSVLVQDACGAEEQPVASLVEAPDAVRGQAHWSPRQWERLLQAGRADLRGGGLAWKLALGPPDRYAIERGTWQLAGEGYVPASSESDRLAETLPPLAPSRERSVSMAITETGGVCRTRSDGRVACWGSTPLSERREPVLLPAAVRWPADLAVNPELGCVLDARGQRACFANLEPVLTERARACSAAPAPAGPVLRRFDDGPWRALAVGRALCGIRTDGALHCFAHETRALPAWAELDGVGVGASYRVPVDGDVQGVGPAGPFGGYAWTADGTIWEWDDRRAPRVIGRVEGVVDVRRAIQMRVAFARTADGRVLTFGALREEDGPLAWWLPTWRREEAEWEEVEALRGARLSVGDGHACARMPDGEVRCWGQRSRFVFDDPNAWEDERPPEEVPALRGASALILGGELTCGVMRGGALRCIGGRLESISNGAASVETERPITVRPDRIAAGIR